MEANPKTSKEDTGLIQTILRKLSTRSIVVLLLAAFVAVTGIFIFAIRNGSSINVFGIKIEAMPHDKPSSDEAESTKQTINNSSSGVSASELALISDKYFDAKLSKDNLVLRIKDLVKNSEELEEFKKHISFKLLELEIRVIPKFGKFIDTRIKDDSKDMREAYQKIQSILKDIGAYDGAIDGNQQVTYNALKEFQAACNDRESIEVFPPGDFGIFGNLTLVAIRNIVKAKEQKY